MKRIIAITASLICCMGNEMPAQSRQLIDDRKVGETLAEVKCGKRPMGNAVAYLNHMGVPSIKLTNITSYPEVVKGYQWGTMFC